MFLLDCVHYTAFTRGLSDRGSAGRVPPTKSSHERSCPALSPSLCPVLRSVRDFSDPTLHRFLLLSQKVTRRMMLMRVYTALFVHSSFFLTHNLPFIRTPVKNVHTCTPLRTVICQKVLRHCKQLSSTTYRLFLTFFKACIRKIPQANIKGSAALPCVVAALWC